MICEIHFPLTLIFFIIEKKKRYTDLTYTGAMVENETSKVWVGVTMLRGLQCTQQSTEIILNYKQEIAMLQPLFP